MHFRVAQQADLPLIVDIYNSTIPGRMVTADTEPVSVESRIHWFLEHSPDKRPLWLVCNSNNDILGWASFSDFNSRPAYRITAEISIYLKSTARQQGLGTQVLAKALAQAPQLGIENVVGLIFAHNEPSLRLFRKAGFEQWGYLPEVALLDGTKRSVVILGKKV